MQCRGYTCIERTPIPLQYENKVPEIDMVSMLTYNASMLNIVQNMLAQRRRMVKKNLYHFFTVNWFHGIENL